MKKVLTAFLFFNLLNALDYLPHVTDNVANNVSSSSVSDDLSSLLNKYEKESDLSKQTRVESLGHVVVFTRRDIERMQFDTLSDLLKYVKLTSFSKVRFGTNSLVQLGDASVFPSSVRLYLNDMDLSSAYTDSPFFIYSHLSLTHIDHVEIYLGAAALKLGNYPSAIVIKLYTKKPEREDSTLITTRYYNNNSFMMDGVIAKKIDEDSDYLILLDKNLNENKDITIHNQDVSNNSHQAYTYMNYRYKKSHFELSYITLNSKPFMGLSADDAPDATDMTDKEYYVMYTYNNQKYKLNLSYANNKRDYTETNKESDDGLLLPVSSETIIHLDEKRYMNKLNISLSKIFKSDNNSLFSSISMQNRINDVKKFDYTTADGKKHDGKDDLKIKSVRNYSLALEDNYNINERNLFFSSLKYDNYKGSYNYKDTDNYIARIGFITIPNKNLKMRGFFTKSYLPVTILQQEFAKTSLKQTNGIATTFETIYTKEKNKYSFLVGYSEMKNLVVFDENATAKNLNKKIDIKYLAITYKREITENSKMDLAYSKVFFHNNTSSKNSIIGKFVSTIDKFDIFTGMVYNTSYKALGVNVNSSFDMDGGLIYHIDKHISLKIKGNNIFNDSSKSVYKTSFGSGTYDNNDREFSISFEMVF